MKKNNTTKIVVTLVIFLVTVIYTLPSTPLWVSAFGSLSPDEQTGVPLSMFKFNENADGSVSVTMAINLTADCFSRKKNPITNQVDFLGKVSETIRKKLIEMNYNIVPSNANNADLQRTLTIASKESEKLTIEKIKQGLADSKLYAKYDLAIASIFPSNKITLGLDLKGGLDIVYKVIAPEGSNITPQEAVNQSIVVVRNRIDQYGVAEPSIKSQGEDRIRIQIPGVSNPDTIKNLIKSNAMLQFHLVLEQPAVTADSLYPIGSDEMILMSRGSSNQMAMWYKMKRIPDIKGSDLRFAKVGFDEYGKPIIHIEFNAEGATKFYQVTGDNVGNELAIVLMEAEGRGRVLSAPVIKQRIHGGTAQISGNFSFEEAELLAVNLRAGALPATLKEEQSMVIGPTLGEKSIKAGFKAGGIGFLFVMAFMIIIYKTCGVVSCLALLFNSLIVFSVLVIFGGTMTLPGIAGFVLSVGMSVDANVIIFERIREEYYSGKTVRASIASGFDRAFSCILDSNVTTLLIVAILYYFTSGSIRGFATTLGIGLVANLYTAVFFSKLCIEIWFLNPNHPNRSLGL